MNVTKSDIYVQDPLCICTHLATGHGKWVEHGAIKTWSDHCIYQMLPLQAQVLQWKCFKKLQHVYDTQLWSVIEPTLDAIVAGIKVCKSSCLLL